MEIKAYTPKEAVRLTNLDHLKWSSISEAFSAMKEYIDLAWEKRYLRVAEAVKKAEKNELVK